MSYDPEVQCSEDGCSTTIRNHRWAKIRSGWFFTNDNKGYCPEHIPDWVAEWRAKRAARAKQGSNE